MEKTFSQSNKPDSLETSVAIYENTDLNFMLEILILWMAYS